MGLSDINPPQQTLAVNGTAYTGRAAVDAAAADYNKPQAVST